VAVPGAAAGGAVAAAGEPSLRLRARGWLDVLDVSVSTVASWHVDLLGRRDLTLLTLDLQAHADVRIQ
jgi:hypothetical protein